MTLSYLALGDSYTIGEGVDEASRWPMQLARSLRQAGIAIADPRIIAATGWSTDELSAAMDTAEPLCEWGFVTLLIGVNNQYRGHAVDAYGDEFVRLLRRAIGLADGRVHRVLVLSIPDWGVTPFDLVSRGDRQAIADELDTYNAAARESCEAHGVAFVDITGISRDGGGDPAMLADDGLHPSAAQYASWAEAALPVAVGLLAGQAGEMGSE